MGADAVSGLVSGLAGTGQLAPGAVVVYEHAARTPGLSCAGLDLVRSKTHGVSTVDLLTYDTPSGGAHAPAAGPEGE